VLLTKERVMLCCRRHVILSVDTKFKFLTFYWGTWLRESMSCANSCQWNNELFTQ